ncbi:MAG: ABC transporter substrate-binding protein [Betaproteobacteria bacterium]|nr:ABC transporter substrate-binding protein [Betaproteobacteria bacterium]
MSTSRTYLSLRRTASVIALAASALWAAAPAQAQSARIPAPAALAGKGVINYCATIDNPPRAYFDEKQQPIGFEVELGTEIASRMGLKVNWVQLKFPGLVPALQAQQCDAIMQELFIRAERLEIIDMVPFSRTGQQIVVRRTDNSLGAGLEDLSGKKLAVPNGTTIHNLAVEANKKLKDLGKPEINLVVLPTTTDTFQQLATSQVDAVGTTSTAGAYYVRLRPNDFKAKGDPFGLIGTGIGIRKGNTDLTNAVKRSLDSLVADGSYKKLIEKWNMQGMEL